ncbi:FG-GAP repeat protein (macronuclear) [Tetrahymena thermophila SB210]|uniref:FG-GAP repeat protein n=1 Tax=Tetrahymena thermophila (strain SB210) TaxID=312017 RepID=I7M2R1_TETTS|nr:FG-GAP repeat protein [Tetrahymena thermophila SB210]EAS01135.2 FG-GAP repeat protein [Tetrahymena thermophila SB210]|eukprot:XP_001021380.2 FG-GAP repeat protein [Tetrahymena thermophila SB210]
MIIRFQNTCYVCHLITKDKYRSLALKRRQKIRRKDYRKQNQKYFYKLLSFTFKQSRRKICLCACIYLLIFIFAISSVECASYKPSDFVNSIFNFSGLKEGLYQINILQNQESDGFQGETIMGFGHYNKNDQYAGIITRDQTLKKLNLYLWNSSQKFYNKINTFCSPADETCSKDIKNIIPIDWDYNGYLDLIIISDNSDGIQNTDYTAHFLFQYVQNIQSSECTSSSCTLVNVVSYYVDSNTQPFIIPYYKDTQHLHGLFYYKKTEGFQKRVVIIGDPNDPTYQKLSTIDFSSLVEQDNKQCINGDELDEILSRRLPDIHFSSVLDLNGDCRNDLFIHSVVNNPDTTQSHSFEFYIRLENGLYCLTQVYKVPPEQIVQAIGFTDINFDGGIDMVIVYNDQDHTQYKSKMQIAFNHITPSAKNLCSENDIFTKIYGDLSNIFETQSDILIIDFEFRIFKSDDQINYPSLRFGDFNLDGYNDLLMTITKDSIDSYSYFFENTYCDLPQCEKLLSNHKRYFELQGQNTKYGLISSQKSISASFFDFNENGQLDIILNTYTIDPETLEKQISVTAIYNFLKTDSYFVKAFVMNGSLDGTVNNDYTSSNIYGATVVCKVISIEEQVKPIKGIQLYQSAFIPLQIPYVIMGIARTNSYIENLSVGLGLQSSNSVNVWNPIIPNSQINIYPSKNNPDNWKAVSFMVNVTESLLAILIIAACILVVLGIVIYYLFLREKNQDKREIEVANLLI